MRHVRAKRFQTPFPGSMPQYPSTMSPLRNPPAMSDSQRSVRGTASVDENTRCSLRADLMPTLSAILRDMGKRGSRWIFVTAICGKVWRSRWRSS